jgi:molybdenum cofactor cytidylyltransferase
MILGILLAAGASHRMGRDKLALPWRGSTVLSGTLVRWTAVPELDEILLVSRPDGPEIRRPGVRTLVNAGADEGMGSSLRLAAHSLPSGTKAVVVGLADMPEIASGTVSDLVGAWRPLGAAGIVAPVFRGQRGHPVVLGANYFPALRALTGDRGARSILQTHADDLRLLDVDDPGVLIDLDTPADLEQKP